MEVAKLSTPPNLEVKFVNDKEVKLRAGRNSVLINSWIIHEQTLDRNLKKNNYNDYFKIAI